MENGTEVPQKFFKNITNISSNSTFGYLSKENKNTNLQRYTNPMFIAELLTIAKLQKQPKYPLMDE